MAVITVPASGLSVSDATLDDVLQAGSDVSTSSNTNYFVDGTSTLRSLYIGTAIEVDVGLFSSASLRGTGNILGDNDPTVTLPALVNYGVLDINGTIAVALSNNNQLVVGAGEQLRLEGDLFGLSASTVMVAAGGEFDLNSQNTAIVSALSSQGLLRITAPNTSFSGATTLAGTVVVQGDATNGVGSGTAAARATGNAGGTYVATFDLRNATLTAPITSLTLGQDAQVRFGTDATVIRRLVVAGSANGLVPLDVVSADGALTITGDGTGTANGISVSQAEFAGGTTIDFAVSSADGGASLQNQIVVDAGTTLRNDGRMTIGGQGTAASAIGAVSAAASSTFVNAGQLTLGAGASLSVAAVQNTGTITVTGNVNLQQAFTNSGSIDVAAGTLALQSATQGSGTVTVESGATLSIAAAATQTVALRSGSVLSLSQPGTFAGTIQAPVIGARIDLAGLSATAATVSNGTIAVTTANGSFALAETGLTNGTALAISADGAGGSTLSVTANNLPHPVAYRFFDSVHGVQFLTTSLTETQMVQATRPDYVYEGVGLGAADPAIDPAAAPVYRFFDTKFGTHFYTSSATERNDVVASRSDLTYEGVGFYEHNTQQAGDVAVYRFFDSNFGTHFYTSSATERATVVATRPDLVSEGISFYSPTTTV